MSQRTEKLYHPQPFLKSCSATVVEILEDGIIVDRTIAYAEAGGQQADIGNIEINGEQIPFINVIAINNIQPKLDNFPDVKLGGQNLHILANSDDLTKFNVGDSVTISIDIEHRALVTSLHSALHCAVTILLDMEFMQYSDIVGTNVTTKNARLDCLTEVRFSEEVIAPINEKFKQLIDDDVEFRMYAHPDEPEALYWRCNDHIIPCGGTHVQRSSDLNYPTLSRKRIGSDKDRLVIKIETKAELLQKYHD